MSIMARIKKAEFARFRITHSGDTFTCQKCRTTWPYGDPLCPNGCNQEETDDHSARLIQFGPSVLAVVSPDDLASLLGQLLEGKYGHVGPGAATSLDLCQHPHGPVVGVVVRWQEDGVPRVFVGLPHEIQAELTPDEACNILDNLESKGVRS